MTSFSLFYFFYFCLNMKIDNYYNYIFIIIVFIYSIYILVLDTYYGCVCIYEILFIKENMMCQDSNKDLIIE